MNTLEFKIPKGYELDEENSSESKLIYKKKQYPISWKEYFDKDPCFFSWMTAHDFYVPNKYTALGKLELLRDAWNKIDGFKVDWKDLRTKFTVSCVGDQIIADDTMFHQKTYFSDQKKQGIYS